MTPSQALSRKPGIRNWGARTPWAGAIVCLLLATGCGGGFAADIKAASQFQISAQSAYEAAKAADLSALMRCRDAALAAGAPLPPGLPHATLESRCVGVGAPLPYPLGFLDGLQVGVDGLYDAIQGASAALDLSSQDPAAASAARVKLVGAVSALLKDVGVLNLPPDQIAAAKSLAGKR